MLEIGRRGRIYVVSEADYGVHPGHASTDAVRHINFVPSYDPKGKVSTPEKKDSPGREVGGRFDRRKVASWTLEMLLRPSGTLNTAPEADKILLAAFGAKTNVILATTVSAGTGAVGGATLASAAGLAVGDCLSIVVGGVKYGRFITAVNTGTGVTTWAPNLPGIPADGAVVKAGITYKLTTALTKSLGICHYGKKSDGTAGFKRQVNGCVVDRFALSLDANDEPRLSIGGGAKDQVTGASVAAVPAGFTSVGTQQPPSGLSGALYVNNAGYRAMKWSIEMTNAMSLRNDSFGYDSAEEAYRSGYRSIACGLDARVDDEAAIYDNAESGTNVAMFTQSGLTEGNIIVVRAPQVEFKVPDTDDPDDAPSWPFKGMALESLDGMNDELFIGLL